MRAVSGLLLIMLCCEAGAAPSATLELLPEASVRTDVIALGQVARIQSTDLELMRALVNLNVGMAPTAGGMATVSREALVRQLRVQDLLAHARLDWSGPSVARIVRARSEVAGREIGGVAANALREWMKTRGVSGEVMVAASPRDLQVPAGDIRLKPRDPGTERVRSRMMVWVDVWSAESLVRTVPVTLEVLLRDDFLRAARSHPAEEQTGLATARDPEKDILVARGEWASLRTVSGAVLLESRVEVLQDGRPGERVRVRPRGTQGPVFARVLSRGVLELVP